MTVVKLNKALYTNDRVEMAIAAYKDIADIKRINGRDHYILLFLRCRTDEALTANEFENYLIGLENS